MKSEGRMFLFLAETCALCPSWTGDLEFPGGHRGERHPQQLQSRGLGALPSPDLGELVWTRQREEQGRWLWTESFPPSIAAQQETTEGCPAGQPGGRGRVFSHPHPSRLFLDPLRSPGSGTCGCESRTLGARQQLRLTPACVQHQHPL